MATLWDYFTLPDVKEKLRDKIRQQIELLHNGLDRPEAIVGMTYLEELPQHFDQLPLQIQNHPSLHALGYGTL